MSTAFEETTLAVRSSSEPTKRVNYVNGMILGVDDFIQEATYLLARDRWLAREALGYGTLTGLDVTVSRREHDSDEPGAWQVNVSPGVALTPTGHLVEVPREQCAVIDDWLIANHEDVDAPEGDAPLSLYVVLRYDECLTDSRPVPGEPCGTQDVYSAKARITDDFALELSVEAPDQVEEEAVRAFAAWLATIPLGAATHSDDNLAQFASLLRVFAAVEDPLPEVIEFKSPDQWGTLPPPAGLTIPESHAPEYLRTAFHLWATEFRPALEIAPRSARSTGPGEEYVLLARLGVMLQEGTDDSGNEVHISDPDAEPIVNDSSRPLLAHLRLVQEWLLHQRMQGETPDAPPPSIELGDAVTGETAFGRPSNVGTSTKVARADHTHGTPPDPIPAHRNDVNAHTLAGDVTGGVGATRVQALQGRNIAANVPAEGNVLRFTNGSWRPAASETSTVRGPYVEHPADAGPYHIVAAGTLEFFFGEGMLEIYGPNDNLYNNLKPVNIDPEARTLTIRFDDYEPPDFNEPSSHRYIVKVTPWLEFRDEQVDVPFVVAVRRIHEEGIDLQITPMQESDKDRGRIMIEISRYSTG